MEKQIKSGFVALVGKPNVGKSTLLNYIVGQKIAIVTTKPQTTRQSISGVKTTKDYQIVFVDTPGFYKPLHLLGKKMQTVTRKECGQADLICLMVEANNLPTEDDLKVVKLVFKSKKRPPVFLVVNKIDLISKNELIKRIKSYEELGKFAPLDSKSHKTSSLLRDKHLTGFTETISISSVTGENVEILIKRIINYLPAGPAYFSPESFTDKDKKFLVSELIREKAINLTRQEIPHCLTVDIEEMKEGKTPEYIYIYAIIYVEKDSQKGIIIGKSGRLLKKIGTQARQEIEKLLNKKVFLELRVKTKPDWRQREDVLKAWGYE